jgi:hypothetical protein
MKATLKNRKGVNCIVEIYAAYSSFEKTDISVIKTKIVFLGRKKSFSITVGKDWLFDQMCNVLIGKRNQVDSIIMPMLKNQILDFLDETLEMYDEED